MHLLQNCKTKAGQYTHKELEYKVIWAGGVGYHYRFRDKGLSRHSVTMDNLFNFSKY